MTTRWCCQLLQNEFGPMELDELRELARSGTLGPGDLVRRETEEVWRAASQCVELRAMFGRGEPATKPQPTFDAHVDSPRTKSTSKESIVRQKQFSAEHHSDPSITPCPRRIPTTPRQRRLAWSATFGLLLILYFANWLIGSATPTFPQPRAMREQMTGLHWFLGTGPWSFWEYLLLWVDSLVILFFISEWVSPRFTK